MARNSLAYSLYEVKKRWSRRDLNPRPDKETYALSTCLFAFDFRERAGQQLTDFLPYVLFLISPAYYGKTSSAFRCSVCKPGRAEDLRNTMLYNT